jgi:hypothetical protein
MEYAKAVAGFRARAERNRTIIGFDRRVKLHSNPSCLMPDGGGYGGSDAIKALGRAAWSASQVAQLLAALSFA